MKKLFFLLWLFFICSNIDSQTVKILFDAKKGEQAGNADWIIDADSNNLFVTSSGTYSFTGTESNAGRYPTPPQSGITSSSTESFWKGGISAMAVECAKLGYIVESLPIYGQITYGNAANPQDLSNYRVYVVCEPNIVFTAAEKTAIMTYIQNGGRLLMVADHETSDRNNDGWESRTIWNDFMNNNGVNNSNPFGMNFDSVDIFQTTTNYTANTLDSILNSTLFGSVTSMKYANGTTLTISPTANNTVKGHFYATGANKTTTNVLVATARYGKGKVAGYGDSSPFDDGTGDTGDGLYDGWITDASGNHRKIIMNTMLWLVALDSFHVSITPNPNTAKTCSGDSISLTATQGTTYLWNNGKTTQTIYVKATGTYSVTVTNELGQQTSSSQYVVVNPTPTVSINAMGSVLQCDSFLGGSYQWYINNSPISTGTTRTINVNQSGNYQVSVIDSNGCKNSANYNYVQTTFAANITKSKDSICTGDSIKLSAPLGYTYLWNTGQTTSTIYGKTSGKYSITITNSSNQTARDSVTLFFYPKPTPIVYINSNVLSTSISYISYQWYMDNTPIVGANQYQYVPTTSGNFKVFIQNNHGCYGESNLTPYTFTKFKTMITKSKDSICEADSILLRASYGVSYKWSTGENAPSITVKQSNSYSVTATNSVGDTNSTSINVTIFPKPTPILIITGNQINLSPSYPKVSWYWNSSLIDSNKQSVLPIQSGLYKVKVISANHCIGFSNEIAYTKLSINATPNSVPSINIFENQISIEYAEVNKYELMLMDEHGRIIVREKFHQRMILPTLNFSRGIYFVSVLRNSEIVYREKFIF